MKKIDLLNKIVNGEELPKKIRYKGEYWYLTQKYANILPYYSNGYDKENLFTGEEDEYFSESLNFEVEIIEEDKTIENIKVKSTFTRNQKKIARKINEIIDFINKGE